MWMFLKTDCPDRYRSAVNITEEISQSWYKRTTSIELMANPGGEIFQHIRPGRGKIKAQWDYRWRLCRSDDNFPNRYLRDGNTEQNIFQNHPGTTGDDTGNITPLSQQTQQQQPFCGTVAQILYDGCMRQVKVDAPSLRVTTAHMKNEKSEKIAPCTTRFRGTIKPAKSHVRDTNSTVTVRQLMGEQCDRIGEGRPFIDDTGRVLQSELTKAHRACWSHDETDHAARENPSHDEKRHERDSTVVTNLELATNWMERSLGEHSSVASFAALTISLLTNNAPPALIRDAIRAALDEVNHAATSFKMASLLSGDIVEPGPLPPSSLRFETDIRSLAWRTFKEGCVGETLSAVVAAAESLMAGRVVVVVGGRERKVLMEKELSRIAMDEARHAALAFRTVHWACTVESQYCRDNIADHFNDPTVLSDLVESRLGVFGDTDYFRKRLEYMYGALMGFVTGASTDPTADQLCEYHVSAANAKDGGIVNDVIHDIVTRVLCASSGNMHGAIE